MNIETLKELNTAMNRYTFIYNQNVTMYFNEDTSIQKVASLSFYQHQTLLLLYYNDSYKLDESYTLSEISKILKIPCSNAFRVAEALIKKGFCIKKREKGKKASRLFITEKGESLINKDVLDKQDKYLELYNKHITLKEQRELLKLYNRLSDILSKIPPSK